MSGNPYLKTDQLSRAPRRTGKRASPKQWQAIIAAKRGPCRVCEVMVPHPFEGVEYHHLVARVHGGGDTADNIVPLCSEHHGDVTKRHAGTARILLAGLSDAEYAYMVTTGGEDYAERAYGVDDVAAIIRAAARGAEKKEGYLTWCSAAALNSWAEVIERNLPGPASVSPAEPPCPECRCADGHSLECETGRREIQERCYPVVSPADTPEVAQKLAEHREHAEWVRDYLKPADMDGISAHSLNGRLLVVLDIAAALLAVGERDRRKIARLTEALERIADESNDLSPMSSVVRAERESFRSRARAVLAGEEDAG